MFGKLYDRLASLNLGIWLTFGVIICLAVGSFTGGGAESSSINDMPLLLWLRDTPIASSWWLWATIALLALLALNTVFCSIESLRTKAGRTNFLILIAPQVMHLGFLLIVLAHLFSASGSVKQAMQVYEGSVIGAPDGSRLQFENLRAQVGPMGMPTDFSADVRIVEGGGERLQTVSPNHPAFHGGFGIYLKHLEVYPFKAAIIEIHREPGAGLALAGALLFTVGNVVLLSVRRGK